MPTVAELDVQIDAKDDASATIMALDALVKELDNGDVTIDIDASTFEARAQIRELMTRLQQLDAQDVDVDIDISTGGAAAEIAALRAELAGLRDEEIDIRINDDSVRRGRTSMDAFRNSAMQASRSVNGMAAAVLGLGAALIPLGVVAAGGIAALVGSLAVAGIGIGLFGAVAVTNFTKVRENLKLLASAQEDFNKATTDEERDEALAKTKAIMDSMDPATRAMTQAVLDFKSAWRGFATQFQPQVFQIATEGLEGIAALLPSLAPIVEGTAGAFLSLEKSAFRALQGPFWQSFFQMVGANVGPILNQLVRSIGYVVQGFAALIMAFMPLSRDMTTGMLNMSKAFARWSESLASSQGFQTFVAYIREQTPAALRLIGALVLAMVAIGEAAAPIGEKLISMVTGLSMAIVAFEKAHPLAATIVLGLVAFLAILVKLLGPVLMIGHLFKVMGAALMMLGTPLASIAGFFGILTGTLVAIVAVIAAVVAGLVYAYFHFETFRNIVNMVANAVATFAVRVYDAIVVWLGQAAAWLSATFAPAIAAVMAFITQQFDKIKNWVTENGPVLQEAWNNIVLFVTAALGLLVVSIQANLAIITAIWQAVWPALSAILSVAWELIKSIVSGALDIIMGIIQTWAGLLAGDWSAFWGGIKLTLSGVWTIMAGIVRAAYVILQGIIDAGMAAIKAVFTAGWNAMVSGLRSAWETMKSIASAAWGALKSGASASMNAIQDTINAGWAAVGRLFKSAWSLMIEGLSSAWSTAKSLVSGGINAIVGLISALPGKFRSAGASMMSSLAAGIRAGIGQAVGAAGDAISRITDLLPGSPAKVGPLSGEGYAMVRGQHLAEDLAAGMASRAGLVGSAARDIADLMTLGTNSSAAFDAITGGTPTGVTGATSTTISIAPGAVVVSVGDGASVNEAREAFTTAGDEFADKLLMSLRRQ